MHARIRKLRMLRRLRRRFVRDERGLQLAELAIVLPILLILFGATTEFGRFFYEYSTLAKATRVGARYLITAKVSDFEKDKAKKLVVFGNTAGTGAPLVEGLELEHVVITARNLDGEVINAGVPATITVEIAGYKYEPLVDLGGMIKSESLSLNVEVKPSVTMRYLLTTPLV